MRVQFAPQTRWVSQTVLVGGSPLRFVRVTTAARVLVDSWVSGSALGELSSGQTALLVRLVDAGMLLLCPEPLDGLWGLDDVTVVIPAKDRVPELAQTLASLRADTPSVAAIVVDDGSTDRVAIAEAAAEAGARVFRRDASGGPAAARNSGAAIVTTELVAFVDSDIEVTPGWLAQALGYFCDGSVALVAPRVLTPQSETSLGRYEAACSPLDLGAHGAPIRAASRVSYVPAAAVVLRREHFNSLGGFDESLTVGEDVDLCWRLAERGHRLFYAGDRSVVEHHADGERVTLRGWLRRRYDYGTSAAVLDQRHPGSVAPLAASRWSIAAWALFGAGHPVAGTAVAVGTSAALARRLRGVCSVRNALRIGLAGHLAAGEQMGRAMIRPWFPFTLGVAVVSRRGRRAALASCVIPPVLRWFRKDCPDSLGKWVGFSLLDDLAYSSGVWSSSRAQRSIGAVLPRFAGSAGGASRNVHLESQPNHSL